MVPVTTLMLGWVFLIIFPTVVAAGAGETWRAVTDRELSIEPNSALDFSFLNESGPAGRHGSIVIRRDGHLAFDAQVDKPARFFCASQPFGIEEGFPDHTTADRYAHQLRMHGYNLARFVFVDNVLMNGRTRDFDFDPTQLDRFYYFLAALKREGIYWVLDGLTSWNAAYGDVGGDRWVRKRNVKLGVYYDPTQRAHWKGLISHLLGTVNVYTGQSPLRDPALAGVILVNEGGLNSQIQRTASPEMNRLFEEWLIGRYGSVLNAQRHWGIWDSTSSQVALPRKVWTTSPKMADTQRFYYELQAKTIEWMSAFLLSLGYKGPVTAFDDWPTLQDHASRSNLNWIDYHVYHDQPSDFVNPGSRITQSSSLEDGLAYVREASIARHWGKPFSLTEYDQPFWNRWRFESGLAMGAYAGFQGWDLLCRHASGPIELAYGMGKGSRRKAIYPFGIGMDPVARAGETLAALLFLRGDVRAAKRRVGLILTPFYVFDEHAGIGQLPNDITRLGLITGIGLLWHSTKATPALDAVFDPDGVPSTLMNKLGDKVGPGTAPALSIVLSNLRKRGILLDNKSDGTSLYESDTGEISLDTDAKVLEVITTRTEAAAFARTPGNLNALNVRDASGPALVSASSLDSMALEKSRRILLILAPDAKNSGMQFADPNEEELVRLGGLPILMRNVRVELSLRHSRPETLSLYALRLNGEREEKLPVNVIGASTIVFTLDTGSLAYGPTTFFELVDE
jgi:hypothetical protein